MSSVSSALQDDWFCESCKSGDRTTQASTITTLRQRFLAGGHGLAVCKIMSITALPGVHSPPAAAAASHSWLRCDRPPPTLPCIHSAAFYLIRPSGWQPKEQRIKSRLERPGLPVPGPVVCPTGGDSHWTQRGPRPPAPAPAPPPPPPPSAHMHTEMQTPAPTTSSAVNATMLRRCC